MKLPGIDPEWVNFPESDGLKNPDWPKRIAGRSTKKAATEGRPFIDSVARLL